MTNQFKLLFENRFRLSTQIYVGIGAAVLLTISASLVAWLSFNQIGNATTYVKDTSVPEMVSSFGIAQYSGALAAAAPRLTSASTIDEFTAISAEIAETQRFFEEYLQTLSGSDKETIARVRQNADQLINSIEVIRSDKEELLSLDDQTSAISLELTLLQNRIDRILIPAIDDQLFYTMTGYSELGEAPAASAEHFSVEEFYRYRNISDLQAVANTAIQLVASAFSVNNAAFVEPLRERSESARSRIERGLGTISDSLYAIELRQLFDRLFEISLGENGGFAVIARVHELGTRQQEILEFNRTVSLNLVELVDDLVDDAEISAAIASDASLRSIVSGRAFLLIISTASIGGAFLITWLFVGRVLLRRIHNLSDRMVAMAQGDLETQVEISGRDEVAEMAGALEIFRQHALEIQRLNLVEEMADELQEKNEQLENVLDDLQTAQDQIIMQGKLAALGELTAGVAHEIRNPLNFVNNFSEASEELLEELQEVIEECEDDIDENQMEYIEEITGDLISNLQRIKSHGDRANRIVHGMLAMGRESTDAQDTNINMLIQEYAQLAYHSGRATNPNMNLEIITDFDENVPLIMAIPQDLGRVFLNMVTNAWQATEDKRDKLRENDSAAAAEYVPGLHITTRLREDGIEIRFRDNGTGIPEDAIERIFNPFFTTKSTDRGTGLGLSLSSDIIRSHGGTIRAETKVGEYAEFIIELETTTPLANNAVVAAVAAASTTD